jgi:CBS domain-containing protein
MKTKLVREWMTPDPICAPPEMTLPEAHRIMQEHRIRRLPVVKSGKLVGIVTRGDIRGAEPSEATSLSIWEIHYLLSRLTLDRIMTKDPITISPLATIGEAAHLMLTHKIAGLPVVEDGQVIGIVTESDIFRLVARNWVEEDDPVLALA